MYKRACNTIDCTSKTGTFCFLTIWEFICPLFALWRRGSARCISVCICFNRSHKYFLHLHATRFIANGIYVFEMCVRTTANINYKLWMHVIDKLFSRHERLENKFLARLIFESNSNWDEHSVAHRSLSVCMCAWMCVLDINKIIKNTSTVITSYLQLFYECWEQLKIFKHTFKIFLCYKV